MMKDAPKIIQAHKTKTKFVQECVKKADKYKEHQDYQTLKMQFAEMCESAYEHAKAIEDQKEKEEKAKLEAFLLKLSLDARISVRKGESLDKFVKDQMFANAERGGTSISKQATDAYGAAQRYLEE